MANWLGILDAVLNSELLVRADFSVLFRTVSMRNPLPTTEFQRDVGSLPESYYANKKGYQQLIRKYGTHVIENVTYGARILTTSAKGKCSEIRAALDKRASDVLRYATGRNQSSTIVDYVVGGPSINDLKLNGVLWWINNVNSLNAVPVKNDMRPINDPSLVSSAAKRRSIDLAIEDMKPFQLPSLPQVICFKLGGLSGGQIAGIVIGSVAGFAVLAAAAGWLGSRVRGGSVGTGETVEVDTRLGRTDSGNVVEVLPSDKV